MLKYKQKVISFISPNFVEEKYLNGLTTKIFFYKSTHTYIIYMCVYVCVWGLSNVLFLWGKSMYNQFIFIWHIDNYMSNIRPVIDCYFLSFKKN